MLEYRAAAGVLLDRCLEIAQPGMDRVRCLDGIEQLPTAASISARQAAKSPWPVRPANVGLGKAGTWTSVSGT